MKTLNVLSTNIGSYLTMRQTLNAAKDCIKHFGQGEQVRFELYVYPNKKSISNLTPAIYKDLPYSDPWGRNGKTLLGVVYNTHRTLPKGVKYQIFATRYTDMIWNEDKED